MKSDNIFDIEEFEKRNKLTTGKYEYLCTHAADLGLSLEDYQMGLFLAMGEVLKSGMDPMEKYGNFPMDNPEFKKMIKEQAEGLSKCPLPEERDFSDPEVKRENADGLALLLLGECDKKTLRMVVENSVRLNISPVGYMKASLAAIGEASKENKTIEEIWGNNPDQNPEYLKHLKELAEKDARENPGGKELINFRRFLENPPETTEEK